MFTCEAYLAFAEADIVLVLKEWKRRTMLEAFIANFRLELIMELLANAKSPISKVFEVLDPVTYVTEMHEIFHKELFVSKSTKIIPIYHLE